MKWSLVFSWLVALFLSSIITYRVMTNFLGYRVYKDPCTHSFVYASETRGNRHGVIISYGRLTDSTFFSRAIAVDRSSTERFAGYDLTGDGKWDMICYPAHSDSGTGFGGFENKMIRSYFGEWNFEGPPGEKQLTPKEINLILGKLDELWVFRTEYKLHVLETELK